ncbi:hypothetical protein [Arthrobacter sp. NPDC090010]|uniref:hypothetical protein n=1 Tax=Arthrobacter sp. NPDC090010 TaxID=3363942 RepID=UPI0038239767
MSTERPKVNMLPFEGPNKRPQTGDVFDIRLPGFRLPGRVLTTEMNFPGAPGFKVVYIFNPVNDDWDPFVDRSPLQVSNLLVEPEVVNNLGWSRKYFRTLMRSEFLPGEKLNKTRFVSRSRKIPEFYDEYGNRADESEFPGLYGVGNYATVDASVSAALGVPDPE